MTTLIAPFFGVPTVDIVATATAEASPANAMTCVKPFTIRTAGSRTDPAWDPATPSTYDNKGKPLPNPDVYIPPDIAGYTGYNPETRQGECR